ncbi:MAG: formylglycine-generating enzyme family protein [Magnetospirillum sp.]|nr:formylglycine-generating enzyme family protein [Magnetospirillum sp.]
MLRVLLPLLLLTTAAIADERVTATPVPMMASARNPGDVFRDCPTCPEMVVIPAGSFVMGSNDGDSDEKPVHQASVRRPFAAARHEITVADYSAFVQETGRSHSGGCKAWTGAKWEVDGGLNWLAPGFSQTPRDPVVCVTWDDAQAYVAWLNGKIANAPYRLLTETEWEHAARAGSSGAWFCGAESCVSGVAWIRDNAGGRTHPVGGKAPNPFGLFDIYGNVWEMLQDCYAETYAAAPTDGSAATGGSTCSRSQRGGSFTNGSDVTRSAYRDKGIRDSRYVNVGFRVGRTLP